MKRIFVGLAASALVSGGLGVAGLGLASTAQACNGAWGPCGYGPNHWCPGDSLYMDQGGPYQGVEWDMNVCHTWYRVAEGAGQCSQGRTTPAMSGRKTILPPPEPLLRLLRLGDCLHLPECAGRCGFRRPAPTARSVVGPPADPTFRQGISRSSSWKPP